MKISRFLKSVVLLMLFLLASTKPSKASENKDFYIDKMGILSETTKQKIEEGNRSLGSKGRIFVFTVKKIDEDIDSYAHKTFDVFQLGEKGVLILVVENYFGKHKAAIVVGEELKEILTEDEIDFILKHIMTPFISYIPGKVIIPVNKVDKRISDGFSIIFSIIEREGKGSSFVSSPFIFILFLNSIFLAFPAILHVLDKKERG